MKSMPVVCQCAGGRATNILREFARELAPLLAPLVAAELREGPVGDGWVPQKGSKLGRNNHIEAVRRLQSEGATDRAVTRGKLHLLRRDAYDAELQRAGRKPVPTVRASEEPKGDDLTARFKRRLGAR